MMKGEKATDLMTEKQRAVFELRSEGKTYKEIGKRLNITSGAVGMINRQALIKVKMWNERATDPYVGLSTRARNVLTRSKLYKADLARWFESGDIRKLRDCGRKVQLELCAWAGLEVPTWLLDRLPAGWIEAELIRKFPQFVSGESEHKPILIYDREYSVYPMRGTCLKLSDGSLWWRQDGSNSDLNPSHWMPLPNPPTL